MLESRENWNSLKETNPFDLTHPKNWAYKILKNKENVNQEQTYVLPPKLGKEIIEGELEMDIVGLKETERRWNKLMKDEELELGDWCGD